MTKIGIIGAGRWGKALAELFVKAGFAVVLYCLSGQERELIHLEAMTVKVLSDPMGIDDLEIIFLAVPGENLQDAWSRWGRHIANETIVVNTAKMIDANNHQLILPSNIIGTNRHNFAHLVVAGFPRWILAGSPTIGTVFSPDITIRRRVEELFERSPIEVNGSDDVAGGEIGSAYKNVIAIACGVVAALGRFDEMTRSVVMGRGSAEMTEFACHHVAHPATFLPNGTIHADLDGTCSSRDSRNFQYGWKLAKGGHEKARAAIKGVIEGLHTVQALAQVCHQFQERMPIAATVLALIKGEITPYEAVGRFVYRTKKSRSVTLSS